MTKNELILWTEYDGNDFVEKATIGIVDLVPYVKDVKRAEDIEWPKISRVYYISVKNIKENEKYYED